jgi:hypothetical protein
MYPVHCVTHVSGLDLRTVGGPARIRTSDQRIIGALHTLSTIPITALNN